jgi:hypothetical protein
MPGSISSMSEYFYLNENTCQAPLPVATIAGVFARPAPLTGEAAL